MELIYESVEECIQAELEIRSMERLQAQKRKMNPKAKFTDLPFKFVQAYMFIQRTRLENIFCLL